jgi:hypothetical protein
LTPLIAFTSDFGQRDHYVGVVHGVIAGISPQARVIDLTHGVPAQDVKSGALALYAGCQHFPVGTIHLAVVDPGVGTARRALLLRTERFWFVGPDNGLLTLAAPLEALLGCWELTNSAYHLPTRSTTFHGRDLFGPVAAYLANGVPPEEFGPAAPAPLALPDLVLAPIGRGSTLGTVLAIDGFGNMLTSLKGSTTWDDALRSGTISAWLAGRQLRPVRTYQEGAHGELLLLAGSAGLLEVAVANGSASASAGIGVGASVRVVISESRLA